MGKVVKIRRLNTEYGFAFAHFHSHAALLARIMDYDEAEVQKSEGQCKTSFTDAWFKIVPRGLLMSFAPKFDVKVYMTMYRDNLRYGLVVTVEGFPDGNRQASFEDIKDLDHWLEYLD